MFLISNQIRGQELQIDHVISAFSNLDDASFEYSKMGFTLKKGHLHENGLVNAHIKLSNKTYYELISIQEKPKDSLASFYQQLINQGNGKGAFLSLTGIPTYSIESVLKNLDVKYQIDKTKSWNIISFPQESDLSHIFFIDYISEIQEKTDTPIHQNNTEKIVQVVIQGSSKTIEFFQNFGFKGAIVTNTGEIKIVPKKETKNRFKVSSITFGNRLGQKTITLNF